MNLNAISKIGRIIYSSKFFKRVKKSFPTNKTIVKKIAGTWSLDELDLVDYGPKNNGGFRFALRDFDNFSNYGWTRGFKTKKAIDVKNAFGNIFGKRYRLSKLILKDDGKEFGIITLRN